MYHVHIELKQTIAWPNARWIRAGSLISSVALSLCAWAVVSWSITAAPAVSLPSIATVSPGDSIQTAINSANSGDTIVINPGIYTESLTLAKPVSLIGISSATTIINAQVGRVLTVTGSVISNSVIISGLTFSRGDAHGEWWCPAGCGGGILITDTAQPLIENVIVSNNTASYAGGGIYADSPLMLINVDVIHNYAGTFGGNGGGVNARSITLTGGRFEDNSCGWASYCKGGGLYTGNLILSGTRFIHNVAAARSFEPGPESAGGGVYVRGNAIINNAIFENNACINGNSYHPCDGGALYVEGNYADSILMITNTRFVSNTVGGDGGGVYRPYGVASLAGVYLENNRGDYGGGLSVGGTVTLTDSDLISNTAYRGGGLYAAGNVSLNNDRFINNTAKYGGSGASLGGQAGDDILVVNTLFARNALSGGEELRGAALVVGSYGNVRILHTTIVGEVTGTPAILISGGRVGITNTLIASHTVGISVTDGIVFEDYNLFFNNIMNKSGSISGGTNDVSGNPDFADPVRDDYHLRVGSLAIDVGVDASIASDLDGNSRPVNSGFDIGAYEYQGRLYRTYLPLLARNP